MNTGIQDAMNLGWKLAATVHGWAPRWLLDSYHTERHPVGRAALRITDTLQRIALAPAAVQALRPILARAAVSLPPVRRALRRRVSGLAIAYPSIGQRGEHHLVGRRAPDAPLGDSRLYARMRHGRFTLLDRSRTARLSTHLTDDWSDRVVTTRAPASVARGWPAVTLIRPDGYIAWAADRPDGVGSALREWCGPA